MQSKVPPVRPLMPQGALLSLPSPRSFDFTALCSLVLSLIVSPAQACLGIQAVLIHSTVFPSILPLFPTHLSHSVGPCISGSFPRLSGHLLLTPAQSRHLPCASHPCLRGSVCRSHRSEFYSLEIREHVIQKHTQLYQPWGVFWFQTKTANSAWSHSPVLKHRLGNSHFYH